MAGTAQGEGPGDQGPCTFVEKIINLEKYISKNEKYFDRIKVVSHIWQTLREKNSNL